MKIFLNYAGAIQDQMVARIIGDRLDHLGHDVLINFSGIAGGENWKQAIDQAIQESDWFVPLLSSNYEKSERANRQLHRALEQNKPILPVVLEQISAPPALLRQYHFLDISGDLHSGIERINELLAQGHLSAQRTNSGPSPEDIAREKERFADAPQADRIFIAYSHHQQPLAKDLSEMLIKNGKAVFWDAKIKAGATWRQTIQKALDDATHVVVIWTPQAAESDEVEREVSYALAERKVIVPILSKEIAKLPYHLHGLHYIVLENDVQSIEVALIHAIAQHTQDEDIWQ